MKLVNAEIKSKKELAQRLLDGEVLYTAGGKELSFDEESEYPWQVVHDWEFFFKVMREPHWYENIAKPVPCRVWDDSRPGELLRWVEAHHSGRFQDTDGDNYEHAEPLTAEDIL